MAEYNLKEQSISNETVWRQYSGAHNTSNTYTRVVFSGENYWNKKFSTASDCSATYCPLYSGETRAYVYDLNSNLFNPMENYKDYLEIITGFTLSARPMSFS